jgi:hypothetical protein
MNAAGQKNQHISWGKERDMVFYILFFVHFLAVWSVLATPLLMSPHFVFLRDVWIRTQSAAVASRRATNSMLSQPSPYLATHLPSSPPLSLLSHPSPYLATHRIYSILLRMK